MLYSSLQKIALASKLMGLEIYGIDIDSINPDKLPDYFFNQGVLPGVAVSVGSMTEEEEAMFLIYASCSLKAASLGAYDKNEDEDEDVEEDYQKEQVREGDYFSSLANFWFNALYTEIRLRLNIGIDKFISLEKGFKLYAYPQSAEKLSSLDILDEGWIFVN